MEYCLGPQTSWSSRRQLMEILAANKSTQEDRQMDAEKYQVIIFIMTNKSNARGAIWSNQH